MKNIFFFLVIFCFNSCDVTKTAAVGIENQSFLLIEGDPNDYPAGVQVIMDGKTRFVAEVNKPGRNNHPKMYGITTGQHKIQVFKNAKVIYDKVIFLTSQQTKKIILQ
jgi:hypothetical protein